MIKIIFTIFVFSLLFSGCEAMKKALGQDGDESNASHTDLALPGSSGNGNELIEPDPSMLEIGSLFLNIGGDGTAASPYQIQIIAGAGDGTLTLADTDLVCEGVEAFIGTDDIENGVLSVSAQSIDQGDYQLTCQGSNNLTHISLSVMAPRLAFSGASASDLPLTSKVVTETPASWNLTGNCDAQLGDVSISGPGIDSEFATPCNANGTFSTAINYDTTSPKFTAYADLAPVYGRKILNAAQAQIPHVVTKLLRSASTLTVTEIATAADLQAMATNDAAKLYVLTSDIDVAAALGATNNWNTIAHSGATFDAHLEGDDHTIANIHIQSANGAIQASILGDIGSGSNISNLTFSNLHCEHTASTASGLSAMINNIVVVYNVHIEGTVIGTPAPAAGFAYNTGLAVLNHVSFTGTISGGSRSAGIVSWPSGAKTYNCLVDATISGSGSVGGVFGESDSTSEVNKCIVEGTVTGSGTKVGGIVGFIDSGYIIQSVSHADVTGATLDTGGMVGSSDGQITDSYATGNVSGDSSVGGLIGGNFGFNTEERCFSTGAVSGTGTAIGLSIGNLVSTPSDFFYLSSSSCTGCDTSNGSGLTAAQMSDASNFTNFDFETIWIMDPGLGRPKLRIE